MTQERYETIENRFWVVDEELRLDYEGELDYLEKDYFTSGELRFASYRKGEILHGPSLFYAKNGQILSETWYVDGEKMGKVHRYYPTGQLYSLERYLGGLPTGAHEYFYLDGQLKTVIEYQSGKFHGQTKLYWPDGQLKRECHFDGGEMIGEEKFYDEEGRLIGSPSETVS